MSQHHWSNQSYLLTRQYNNAQKLESRYPDYERFSINKYDWQRWVFDHSRCHRQGNVLEIGCGPGYCGSKMRTAFLGNGISPFQISQQVCCKRHKTTCNTFSIPSHFRLLTPNPSRLQTSISIWLLPITCFTMYLTAPKHWRKFVVFSKPSRPFLRCDQRQASHARNPRMHSRL